MTSKEISPMSRPSWWWCALALWAISCGSSSPSTGGPGTTGAGGGGGGDMTDGGVTTSDSSVNTNCGMTGDACADGTTCCSGKCDMATHTCASTLNQPVQPGGG